MLCLLYNPAAVGPHGDVALHFRLEWKAGETGQWAWGKGIPPTVRRWY